MTMMLLSIASVIALALLARSLFRRFRSDHIEAFNEKHRAESRMVGRGEFVDGNRRLDVALAVTPSMFFYENQDMEASIDLQWVREIEYDTELATGGIPAEGKVLRMRSNSQTFEFVLPDTAVERWRTMLPPRSTPAHVAAGGK